jgi:predicted Zn-dependent protease
VALPDVSRETFQDFYSYLAEDEFELAMEVLEALASGTRPPAIFWRLLARVAEQMNCDPQAQRYRANSEPE